MPDGDGITSLQETERRKLRNDIYMRSLLTLAMAWIQDGVSGIDARWPVSDWGRSRAQRPQLTHLMLTNRSDPTG